jgi:hypothetical protein
VAVVLVVVAASCSRSEREAMPAKLVDGSSARTVPVELEGVDGPALLTTVRVVAGAALRAAPAPARCAQAFAPGAVSGPVVVRTSVDTTSVTFRDIAGASLSACVDSAGPREEDRRWCGLAHGTLRSRRLPDPRLDIGCVTRDGARIATAWVEPGDNTTYVVVAQDGYAEVYEIAAGLPVRIGSTRDVDVARSMARFEISENGGDGRLLREYPLEAAVAG